jgi:hypothetical protein
MAKNEVAPKMKRRAYEKELGMRVALASARAIREVDFIAALL